MESFARGKDLQLRTELSTLQHAMEVHMRREPKRDEDEGEAAQAPAGEAGGDTQAVDGARGEADAAPDPFEVAHDLWCAEEERLKALIDLREKQQVCEAKNHQVYHAMLEKSPLIHPKLWAYFVSYPVV